MKSPRIAILFLAWNRLEFTRRSLQALLENTVWEPGITLDMYDDGSTDGTLEYLQQQVRGAPCPASLGMAARNRLQSPVALFSHFLRGPNGSQAEFVAKIDNDTMVPPGWLEECLPLMEQTDLLGIEAFYPCGPGPRQVKPAHAIGGIGLMRRAVFKNGTLPSPQPPSGRFGFGHWQDAHPKARRGWISPALPVCLLNRLPFEPYVSLSTEYVRRGWQRPWPADWPPEKYSAQDRELWAWM